MNKFYIDEEFQTLQSPYFACQCPVSLDNIISIWPIRKWKLQDIKWLTQGHMLARACTQVLVAVLG